MKRISILMVMLMACSIVSFAQWNTSGTNINNTNTGNVGIGTATPTNRLEVSGSTFNRVSSISTSNVQTGFQLKRTGASFATDWEMYVPASSTDLRFFNGADRFTLLANGNVGIGNPSPGSKLLIKTSSATQGLVISNVDITGFQSHFGFTTADQSKIGMSSESYLNYSNDGKWNINSGNTSGTTLPISFNTDGQSRLYVKTNGYVGIGTTSPEGKLDINQAGGQLRLSGGTVAGGVWTNASDLLYLADWNTATKGVIINMTSGNVGIGTSIPDAKLAVKGTIHAQEVKVDLSVPGPDYVFDEAYDLPSLTEIETYINQNKHLPDVPSACEMEEDGINLSEMNMILLKKVEELTLYLLEQQKVNDEQSLQIKKLNDKIENLNK